jgi:ABC-2 type transport system permease protein
VLWGAVFGVSIVSSALSYTTIYKTQAQRDALAAAYGSNKATSILFGPAPDLRSVAGFTAFKISMTLMLLGAVWGLLLSTRMLRGEEDSGRWELLLVGQTTKRRATSQALAGMGAGIGVLWLISAAITAAVGRDATVAFSIGASLFFALAMVASAAMFVAVGALTSQLGATRRQAAAYAGVFLGIAYVIRMIADAGIGAHGLIWASPLGWVEELHPLTAPSPAALVPIVVFIASLVLVAVELAGARDVGTSVVADRSERPARLRLLTGPLGLTARLVRPAVIGWWVAISVMALLYGFVAKSAGQAISSSSVGDVLTKLGVHAAGASAVLGVCFLVFAVLLAFVAASQLAAMRAEEAEGRLEHLVVRPVSRSSWLGGRIAVTVVVLVLGGLLAGVFAWVGAASQGAGVGVVSLLEAGLNVVPPAVVIGGIGVLAYGLRPRWTSVVVYAVLGWSLLIVIVGGIGAVSHWVLDTSVFHQMASAPATSPRWGANAIMVVLGAAAALLGVASFRRRDLKGE